MKRGDILDMAKAYVTKDRQAEHGKPERNFATIADLWNTYLRANGALEEGRTGLFAHDVAVMMMLLKVARIASVPENNDNWIDSAGYAACGGELAEASRIINGASAGVSTAPSNYAEAEQWGDANSTIEVARAARERRFIDDVDKELRKRDLHVEDASVVENQLVLRVVGPRMG